MRQLQNIVRQIVVLNDGTEVTEEMLPESIRSFVNKDYEIPAGIVGSVPRPYDLKQSEMFEIMLSELLGKQWLRCDYFSS